MTVRNQEREFLRAVWRKAYREKEIRVHFKTIADARRIRFSLYNVAKSARASDTADFELLEAVENCSVSMEGPQDGKYWIIVRHKMMQNVLASAAEQLGIPHDAVEAEAPAKMEDSAAASYLRLQSLMEADAAPTLADKYRKGA